MLEHRLPDNYNGGILGTIVPSIANEPFRGWSGSQNMTLPIRTLPIIENGTATVRSLLSWYAHSAQRGRPPAVA